LSEFFIISSIDGGSARAFLTPPINRHNVITVNNNIFINNPELIFAMILIDLSKFRYSLFIKSYNPKRRRTAISSKSKLMDILENYKVRYNKEIWGIKCNITEILVLGEQII